MFVENYKEVFLSYSKKTNYTVLHPTDSEILDEFLPAEEFMEEIRKIPLENVHWKKLYKYTRILEWIAFSFSIFIFLLLTTLSSNVKHHFDHTQKMLYKAVNSTKHIANTNNHLHPQSVSWGTKYSNITTLYTISVQL